MHNSKLPLPTWAIALFLCSTNPKGVSSMKLHRVLRVRQATAWLLAHGTREAWHNARKMNTAEQMPARLAGAEGKRLPYAELAGERDTCLRQAAASD